MLKVQYPLQPSVPMSGMHVNCGNEGHPEEQLESFSVSTTLPIGKLLPGMNLTRTPKNTICSPPTTSHLSQGCHWEITEPVAMQNMWDTMRSAVQTKTKWDITFWTKMNSRSCTLLKVSLSDFWPLEGRKTQRNTTLRYSSCHQAGHIYRVVASINHAVTDTKTVEEDSEGTSKCACYFHPFKCCGRYSDEENGLWE